MSPVKTLSKKHLTQPNKNQGFHRFNFNRPDAKARSILERQASLSLASRMGNRTSIAMRRSRPARFTAIARHHDRPGRHPQIYALSTRHVESRNAGGGGKTWSCRRLSADVLLE